jgi:hypothetical protein
MVPSAAKAMHAAQRNSPNQMRLGLVFHSDLVPPIFPSILTAIPPIDSSYTGGTAGLTNASLRLVNRQDVRYCRLW